MQHLDTTALDLQRTEAEQQPRGPVELDPALFDHVSGGSPKNGWGTVTLAAATTGSPKNGWEA